MEETKHFSLQSTAADADALDHAREFVELVSRRAPERYRVLLQQPEFTALLRNPRRFNHGQLFVCAQFQVFEDEFRRRFPEAGASSCMNAFCSLFLKNDISLANLLELVEENFAGTQPFLKGSFRP